MDGWIEMSLGDRICFAAIRVFYIPPLEGFIRFTTPFCIPDEPELFNMYGDTQMGSANNIALHRSRHPYRT